MPDPPVRISTRTGTRIRVTTVRPPLVFLPGLLGSELYAEIGDGNDKILFEAWPQLGYLAGSFDGNYLFPPEDKHMYLLGFPEHAYHPPDPSQTQSAREFLQDRQQEGLRDVLSYLEGLGHSVPTSTSFKIRVGDLVTDLTRTLADFLRDAIGDGAKDLAYDPMVTMLKDRLGYAAYLSPDHEEGTPILREHRTPPDQPPAPGEGGREDLFYFPFDWRLFPTDLADELNHFVDRVLAYTGAQQVHLVGHSYGSVVGRLMAQQHPEKVDKLFLVGGPHHGAATPLGMISVGKHTNAALDFLFTDSTFRRIACTMPGLYALLPRWPAEHGPLMIVHDETQDKALKFTSSQEVKRVLTEYLDKEEEPHAIRPNPNLWDQADRIYDRHMGAQQGPPTRKTYVVYYKGDQETPKALKLWWNDPHVLWGWATNPWESYELQPYYKENETDAGDSVVTDFSALPWPARDLAGVLDMQTKTNHTAMVNTTEALDYVQDRILRG